VSTLLCTEHLDESGLDSSTMQVWLSRCDRLSFCPNLAHRGARINRTSQTGAALPAWEPIWKCLAGVFFGICAQGYVTGAGASLGPFGIATSGCSAVRKREGDRRGGRGALHPKESKPQRARCSRQPVPQSECHSTLAARPDSGRMDNVVLCSQIMGKLPWLTDQDSLGPGYWICSLAQVVLPLLGTRCRSNHPNPATASGLAAGETLEFLAHVTIRFSLPFRDTLGGG